MRRLGAVLAFFAMVLTLSISAEEAKLVALKVTEPPVLDGDTSDAAWSQALPLKIQTLNGPEITLKAVYTGTDIYILAIWSDSTESVTKNQWTFDGEKWSKSGNEDRIAFMFEISPVEGFRENACYVNCHSDGMYTNADGEKMDTWHWKAHRTNPLRYTDDKYLDNQIGDDGGRHGDSKGEGNLSYSNNRTEDKSKPKHMQNPSILAKDERFLLKEEAVEIEDYSIFKKGDTLPGYLLARPKGSRGDVNSVGKWSNGAWMVEFSRKLNTGNPDDVVFSPPEEVYFGVAVFDNAGGGDHTIFAKSIELMFEEEVEEKASASVIAILAGGALAVFLLRRKK